MSREREEVWHIPRTMKPANAKEAQHAITGGKEHAFSGMRKMKKTEEKEVKSCREGGGNGYQKN